MFYQSLVLVFLLTTSSQIPVARQFNKGSKKTYYWWVFLWAVVVLFWYMIISEPPAVFWTFLLLSIAIAIARTRKLHPTRFRLWSTGCVVLGYTISILLFIPTYHAHQRALARHQPIDLKSRLAYELPALWHSGLENQRTDETASSNVVQSTRFDRQLLEDQSRRFNLAYERWSMVKLRAESFRSLSKVHEGFVADFIAQPAIGVGRLPVMQLLTEGRLEVSDWKDRNLPDEPIWQPAMPTTAAADVSEISQKRIQDFVTASTGENQEPPVSELIPSRELLTDLHLETVLMFAPMSSFGGMNQKFELRGFQPHAFRRRPEDVSGWPILEEWKMTRLELVSLLKHQPPAVYVSAHLPSMDELRNAPSRPTTKFEEVAISKLYEGEELVVETTGQSARMVGSIRAIAECRNCHQVPLGGLLGAFSYRLTRVPIQRP